MASQAGRQEPTRKEYHTAARTADRQPDAWEWVMRLVLAGAEIPPELHAEINEKERLQKQPVSIQENTLDVRFLFA
jgi:hypothetical protein